MRIREYIETLAMSAFCMILILLMLVEHVFYMFLEILESENE